MLKRMLAVAIMIGLVACSSPKEKANAYSEKGMALLKEGKPDKAKLEFQNALQIKKNLISAMYGLALVAEQKGDHNIAYGLYRKVLEQNPKHLQAQVGIGKLLLGAGQLDKALEASQKALVLNKDDLGALTLRSAVLLKTGDAKGAVETANQILAKEPTHVEALVILASERIGAKDVPKAIEYLDKGLQHDQKNIVMRLIKISALESVARLDEAEKEFRQLIDLHPEAHELRQALAQFYLKHDRKAEAESELLAIVKLNPSDVNAKITYVLFLKAIKGSDVAKQQLQEYVKQSPDNYDLKFALVDFYLALNDDKSAEAELREVITKAGDEKNGLKAKGMLAAIVYAAGDKVASEKMVSEMLAVDKRFEPALILKSRMEIQAGKLEEAISDLRTILRDSPNSGRALLLLAQAHEKAGSLQLAEESYLKAFQANKSVPSYGLAYVQFLLKRNQPQRAQDALEEILVRTPGDMQSLKLMAQTKIALGDAAGAQAVAEEIRRAGDKEHVADQILGMISASRKDYAGSIAAFKRAYETAPGELQLAMGLVRAYLQADKPKDAIAFVDTVLQRNPDNIDLRVLQGQLYALIGQQAQAVAAFNGIIQRAPTKSVGYQHLAGFYVRNKQLAEAESAIGHGLEAVPGDPVLRLTLAAIYEMTKRPDDAIRVYEGLAKDKPDAEVVLNNLSSLLSDSRSDKASFNRAYELAQRIKKSEIPQFKDTAGWASYRVGKYAEAVTLLEDAVKKIPAEPVFHYHLGMSYLAKSDKVGARRELEKSLELAGNGNFPPAEEIRKTLKAL